MATMILASAMLSSLGACRRWTYVTGHFDPTRPLQLQGFECKLRHRTFDAMPVVQPGAPNDAMILLFTNFPTTFAGITDDKLPYLVLALETLHEEH